MFKWIIAGLIVVNLIETYRGRKEMADKLDALADRIRQQGTVLQGLETLGETLKANNDTLRQQVSSLTEELGEAADDNDQLTSINATLDANDALIAGLSGTLAPAVVANTAASGESTDAA